jgi:hypothetical protein
LTVDLQDATGTAPDPYRSRWYYLMMPALNFTHKIISAVLFGCFGLNLVSPVQLASLVAIQVRGLGNCTDRMHAHAHAHAHEAPSGYRLQWQAT